MENKTVIDFPKKEGLSDIVLSSSLKKSSGIIGIKGDDIMETNHYTKNEINLLIKNVETRLEGKIDSLSSQIDNLPTQFENMLLKNNEKSNEEQKVFRRWLIGIIITVVPIITSFASWLLPKVIK